MKSVSIPQTNRLDIVRSVVEKVAGGSRTSRLVARATAMRPRQVDYALRTAELLGLLRKMGSSWEVTDAGRELLDTSPGSDGEKRLFKTSIEQSSVVRKLAPGLLAESPPHLNAVARRIEELSDLSPATAWRRAQAILSWRDQVLGSTASSSLFEAVTPSPRREPRVRETPPPEGLTLSSLQVENYGPLRSLTAEVAPFTVMIGRNATGKSTFMDSLGFVSDCLEHGVQGALERRCRRVEELFWRGNGRAFSFAFEFRLPPRKYLPRDPRLEIARYELSIGSTEPPGDGPGVRFERLYLKPSGPPPSTALHEQTPRGWRRVLSLSPKGTAWYRAERSTQKWKTVFNLGTQKLALSNLPEDLTRLPVSNRVRGLFLDGIQKLALHPAVMTSACSPLRGRKFQVDGSNLPMVVRELEERHPQSYQDWTEHLREALPDVDRVEVVERAEDRHLYLQLTYSGGFKVPAWRLSEGTLRVLALTLIPFAARPDAIFLVEEPENGIHPQALEAVHQALSLASRVQVVIASHSPVFVGTVEPRDLLCFSLEDGETRVVKGSEHPVLESWQRDVDLGTLFASRVLG